MPQLVFARSHVDQAWDFELPKNHKPVFSDTRDKEDATSAYVKCMGTSDGSAIWAWIVMHDKSNAGCSPHMVIPGHEAFMTNNAYETHGHCSVRLGVSAEKDRKIHANGVWSPDSV